VKKHHLLITVLVISLLFGAYNFFSLKQQKKVADELFIFSLSQAQAGFALDYSKLDDNDKIFYYIKASSDLNTALHTLNFTSYANIENRQELSRALSELYLYMTELDTVTSRWKTVAGKSELIYNCLHYIVINPNDKKNCEALFKLANNLRLNVENVVINYEATSPDWAVEYKIDGTVYSHDTYYTFKYIGNDADLVKDVNYSFDSSNEGEDGKFILDKTKVYTGKLKLTAGFPKSTDRDITVKIEWNGKKELLTLKKI
jgi:hypothetical protein